MAGSSHTTWEHDPPGMVEELTPADLSARMGDDGDDPFVLDVQPEADYEAWHVPGSENIDIFDELRTDPDAARDVLSTIPEDAEVIVTRTAGPPSERAAQHLHEMGYDVKTLACTPL